MTAVFSQRPAASSSHKRMSDTIIWLSKHASVFLIGFIDSLSLHKTFRILVNDSASARLTLQILATNGLLLLGSIYFYSRGVDPLMNYMKLVFYPDAIVENSASWILYQSLWLLPVCLLCYACSMAWYQDLADNTFRYLQRVPKSTSLTRSVGHVLYGTLVWISAFMQVKILTLFMPVLCSQMAAAFELFFVGLISVTKANSNTLILSSLFELAVNCVKYIFLLLLRLVSLSSYTLGLALLSVMYGWYGFDPKWISAGLDPDERFSILEKHWAYFMGFGFPYLLLMENTNFFTGYGVFLGLFPFCIMLGSVCNYSDAYHRYNIKNEGPDEDNSDYTNSVPLFKMAKAWTLTVIRFIDQKSYKIRRNRNGKVVGVVKVNEKSKKYE